MQTNYEITGAEEGADIELGIVHQPEARETTASNDEESMLPTRLLLENIGKLIFAPENRLQVSAAMALSVATTAISLFAPELYSKTIQTLTNNNHPAILGEELSLEALIAVFVVTSAAAQLMAALTSWALANPTANITQKLVMDCMDHQLKKSLNYYLQMPTRKHTNHIDNGFLTGAVMFPALISIMPTLIQLVLADAYFFSQYGLEMGFSIPVLVIANVIYGALTAIPIIMFSKQANDTGNAVRESMTEMIKSYKTMRDFCKYEYTLHQFDEVMTSWITTFRQLQSIEPKANMGQILIVYGHMLWVAQHIGTRVRSGQYSVQDFIIAIGYLQVLASVLPAFGKMVIQAIAFTPQANAVFKELQQPDEVIDEHPAVPFPAMEVAPNLSFEGVTYYLPKRANDTSRKLAFSNLSFDVASGKRVAIVTESGVGKTTLFNLIFGYDRPTKGVIRINGKSINEMSLQSLQENITVFEQNPTLFKGSIRDNIRYGAPNPDDVTDDMIWDLARETHLDDFLRKFDSRMSACDLIKASFIKPKSGVGSLLRNDFGIICVNNALFTVQKTEDDEQTITPIVADKRKQAACDLLLGYFKNMEGHQSRPASMDELDVINKVANREPLDADVGEGGKALSGGEKQKIALLRCLFKKTQMWLLDEVTASLDAATANEILSTLYARSASVTCLMTNHKLHEVKQFAETIIVIDKQGQIAGLGTHDALLAACPLYKQLWEQCNKQDGLLNVGVSVTTHSMFSSTIRASTSSNGMVNNDNGSGISMRLTHGADSHDE